MTIMGTTTPSYHAVLMLASLADADAHGYAVKKDIDSRTQGAVRLGSTTLYRLLGQLLDEGLIEEMRARPPRALDDERRRYYRITNAGRRVLAMEIRRMDRILLAIRPALAPRSR